jgi:Sperm-tail PG-rich repeat
MLVSTSDQIAKAPTNNSTAKAQYSFPKSQRFNKPSNTSEVFYDLPTTFSKRTTSFGYGKKYDFTSDKEKTPDPGAYNIDQNLVAKKPFSFGISRDSYKSFIQGHFKADPSVPGPGTYTIAPKFSNEGRKISMASKRKDIVPKFSIPGPGTYDQSWYKSPGRYVISTAKNLEVHTFSPKSSQRFPKESKKEAPEPGTYNVDKGFLNNTKILSTVKSSGSIKFGITERQFVYDLKKTPGPGSYRLPSEFGYYETPRNNTASLTSLVKK